MEELKEQTNEEQRAKAIAAEILERGQIEKAQKYVKAARNTLFVLAGLFFLYAILFGTGIVADDLFSLIFYFAGSAIYVVLGFWARTQPKPASILGLILYLLVIALIAVADPTTLYKGVVLKAVIIGYLVQGIIQANKIPKETSSAINTLDAEMMR